MAAPLDRDLLLAAFDEIGRAAIAAGTRLEIAVYGGSALMLAGNFRFATEDVDIAPIEEPWPAWLRAVVDDLARRNDWLSEWFNDGVAFHLSPLADRASDHVEFGTFPRGDPEAVGLIVHVPTAEYMLALKLKACRVADPDKWRFESADILNLVTVLGIDDIEEAIAVLAKYFPKSGSDAGKQRFVLKQIWNMRSDDGPIYPR